MLNSTETTRYTATLPVTAINELKELAKANMIPSVNFGIKQAIDEYLKQVKKSQYNTKMKEAAQDEEFIKRTQRCLDDFIYSDNEVHEEW